MSLKQLLSRSEVQDVEDCLRNDQGCRLMRALRKGQAAIFKLAGNVRGEFRIV
jgi:hypothetical protein